MLQFYVKYLNIYGDLITSKLECFSLKKSEVNGKEIISFYNSSGELCECIYLSSIVNMSLIV